MAFTTRLPARLDLLCWAWRVQDRPALDDPVEVRLSASTHNTLLAPGGGCNSLTCVSIQDLAAVGQELKHLELTAIGGRHDVAVILPQELDIQNLVVVANKLQLLEKNRGKRTH